MRTFFYLPPLKTATGGMAVIVSLASQLALAGHATALAISAPLPARLELDPAIPVLPLKEVELGPEDRWVVPEGWPNALAPGLAAKAACCVFVQNWNFLHGQLPAGVSWAQLPVRMVAISHPVARFVRETAGITAPVISPAVNPRIFHPAVFPPQNPPLLRVAWMPRKNRGLAKQIREIYAARAALNRLPELQWLEIDHLSAREVAAHLQNAHIFLATGFPEGFGLPPLEAMACGCLVAGFTGMGGWEYMRQALFNGFQPLFPLPEVSWGPNGFYAADGDVWGAVLCLEAAAKALCSNGDALAALRENAQKTAAWYTREHQLAQAVSIWNDEGFWSQKEKPAGESGGRQDNLRLGF